MKSGSGFRSVAAVQLSPQRQIDWIPIKSRAQHTGWRSASGRTSVNGVSDPLAAAAAGSPGRVVTPGLRRSPDAEREGKTRTVHEQHQRRERVRQINTAARANVAGKQRTVNYTANAS